MVKINKLHFNDTFHFRTKVRKTNVGLSNKKLYLSPKKWLTNELLSKKNIKNIAPNKGSLVKQSRPKTKNIRNLDDSSAALKKVDSVHALDDVLKKKPKLGKKTLALLKRHKVALLAGSSTAALLFGFASEHREAMTGCVEETTEKNGKKSVCKNLEETCDQFRKTDAIRKACSEEKIEKNAQIDFLMKKAKPSCGGVCGTGCISQKQSKNGIIRRRYCLENPTIGDSLEDICEKAMLDPLSFYLKNVIYFIKFGAFLVFVFFLFVGCFKLFGPLLFIS